MLTATLDRPDGKYAAGDVVTLTVTSDRRVTTDVVSVAAALETVDVQVAVTTPVVITDQARSWVKQSDDGRTAVYTTVA